MKKLLVSALALLALAISPALGQVGGGVYSPSPTLSSLGAAGLTTNTFTGKQTISTTGGNFQLRFGDASDANFNYDLGRNTSDGLAYLYGNQTGANGFVVSGVNGEFARIISTGISVVAKSTVQNATAIPAGGTQDAGYLFSATAHFGAIFGSGAPTASMARGSLYLRSDGLPYYNTNGTTGWDQLAGLAAANAFTAAQSVASSSATSLAVGLNGATNPAFAVDSSTGLQVAGLNVKGAVTGGTVGVSVTDSGAAANLTIDAKGAGTIQIGGTSTGAITLTRATTMSNALTYGGVTLSNAVTGTGNMVLSAGPTLTGTITAAAADFSGAVSLAGTTTQKTGTFQYVAAGGSADVQTLTYSPAVTAYATGQTFYFRAVGSNTTTTPTLNVNGLGAKTMVKRASTALAANDLLINGHYIAIYNGTNMQIINPAVP